MDHVDLVVNNWIAGDQSWLGRVIAIDGANIKIEAIDSTWEARLQEAVVFPDGKTITSDDSKAFLKAVSRKYQGSHVTATAIHDDAHCAFDPQISRAMTKLQASDVSDHIGFWDRVKSVPGHIAAETRAHLPRGSR